MAKVVMIQGTMSNAGKSLITAGLCRIFKEDGYRVAPFKSQNMALNSYITRDGLEMGRAQAMQAQACGIEPSVYMNPVLLKPTTDMGSQVIVNGRSIGNMPAAEYFKYKKKLIPDILKAYEILSSNNDIIVVEGAGSPAEINLKENDIVNMGLAKMLDAPVLLAGDIDRGGVFAQLYGTVELLEKEERDRIKGLIINKFRGDRKILEPGIRMIEEKCKKKVFGVIPYGTVDIEDEDSLSERFHGRQSFGKNQEEYGKKKEIINICVVKLPKISNFTDFAPLEAMNAVKLSYAFSPLEAGFPDMIILPGTKNTIADLKWLRESGWEARIKELSQKGCLVMGICGGYQMLGKRITDEEGVEGGGSIEGMSLLDTETYFRRQKHTIQAEGKVNPAGMFKNMKDETLTGYEIHMGETFYGKNEEGQEAIPFLTKGNDEKDGCIKDNVFGTYFHGIFENAGFSDYIIRYLCEKKNILPDEEQMSYTAYKEKQFGLLSELIRKNLDMEAVYGIL